MSKRKIYLLEAVKNNELHNLILNRNDKKFIVGTVESGILNYSKLNAENYYYWWYEIEDITKGVLKKDFNADLKCFKLTNKGINYLILLKENLGDYSNIVEIADCMDEIDFYKENNIPVELWRHDVIEYNKVLEELRTIKSNTEEYKKSTNKKE